MVIDQDNLVKSLFKPFYEEGDGGVEPLAIRLYAIRNGTPDLPIGVAMATFSAPRIYYVIADLDSAARGA